MDECTKHVSLRPKLFVILGIEDAMSFAIQFFMTYFGEPMQTIYLNWQAAIETTLQNTMKFDVAHDLAHIQRVTATGMDLAKQTQANLNVVYPACMFHDCVNIDKKSPLRSQGSRLSADRAMTLLTQIGYPRSLLPAIHHAICAHSHSAQIEPTTLEAKLVQDADRLDALGAIGLSRCLMLGGQWHNTLYHIDDPYAQTRSPEDQKYCLDHVFSKLKGLPGTMQTKVGRKTALQRWGFIERYLEQLQQEIGAHVMCSSLVPETEYA